MSCQKEMIKNCRPLTVTEPNIKKCFNVTTKSCFYDEKVEHEVVDTYFPKQVCYTDKVPVCNTVYRVVNTTVTREVCSTMPKSYCKKESKVVEDKVCRTEVRMECASSIGYPSGKDSGYDSSSGVGHSSVGYQSGKDSGYGSSSPSCRKQLETKCFTQPRTIQMESCYTRNERSCDFINEPVPRVIYEDECREFEKRYCKMEQRPQKKQIKKYVYHLRCEPKTVQPCIHVNTKKVISHCEPEFYDKCQVIPHEKCFDVPKEYCYKEPVVVKRQKCERSGSSDYSSPSTDPFTSKYS